MVECNEFCQTDKKLVVDDSTWLINLTSTKNTHRTDQLSSQENDQVENETTEAIQQKSNISDKENRNKNKGQNKNANKRSASADMKEQTQNKKKTTKTSVKKKKEILTFDDSSESSLSDLESDKNNLESNRFQRSSSIVHMSNTQQSQSISSAMEQEV